MENKQENQENLDYVSSCSEYLHDKGKVQVEKDVHIYYEVYGSGEEKLLLVMGLGGTAVIWEDNVKYLLDNDKNLQICIYDNRGIGRSSVPSGRYKTSMLAQDAIKLVDSLGWNTFHVAGISMGGMISQEIALAALDRILTLHLGVTHSGGTGSFPPWQGIKNVLTINRLKTPEEKAPIMIQNLYPEEFLQTVADNGKKHKEIAEERFIKVSKMLPPDPKGFRSQLLAVNTHSVGKKRLLQLKKSKIPILICGAEKDILISPKASFYLKSVLNPSEFIFYKNCGHGVIYQEFNNYNDSILRHYKRRLSSYNKQDDINDTIDNDDDDILVARG